MTTEILIHFRKEYRDVIFKELAAQKFEQLGEVEDMNARSARVQGIIPTDNVSAIKTIRGILGFDEGGGTRPVLV